MLENNVISSFESLSYIDSNTGKNLTRGDYEVENKVLPSRNMKKMLANAEPYTIIAIHNHLGSTVPSLSDIEAAYNRKYKYDLIACHNGTLMKYKVHGSYNDIIVGSLLDRAQDFL